MTQQEIQMTNQEFVSQMTSDDAGIRKHASTQMNDFIRLRVRELGFFRKLFDVKTLKPSDLTKQVDTPLPCKVLDLEPQSAGAYSVPFGTAPMSQNITAPRYRVFVDRIESTRYYADTDELLTYDYSIVQVINDFVLTDIMGEEDRKGMLTLRAITTKNGALAVDRVDSELGVCRSTHAGVMDRAALTHMVKGMPSSNRHLNPALLLSNNVTFIDLAAFDRTEAGGDLSQTMLIDGMTQSKVQGLPIRTTIKHDLLPTDEVFIFAEEKFLGKFFELNPITMSTKHEDYILTFYGYGSSGSTIQNIAGVSSVVFSGDRNPWTHDKA